MNDSARLELTRHLEMKLYDYWYEVDFNWGKNAHEYYTKDGVFESSGGNIYDGQDQIKAFYQYRLDRGARTVVHAVTNFRAQETKSGRATSTWFLMLYASDGEPVHTSTPPILIAAMTDQYEQQETGEWLVSHRLFSSLFKGGIPTTSMPTDKTDTPT